MTYHFERIIKNLYFNKVMNDEEGFPDKCTDWGENFPPLPFSS